MSSPLYKTYRWKKESKEYLRRNPLCVYHYERKLIVTATVVDHKEPHRGDPVLFWSWSNWQSLCKHCHDSHKQRLEKSGKRIGCDENGLPLDPTHHWNKNKKV